MYGYQYDVDALDTAWVNVHKMEITNVDLVLMDVQTIQLDRGKTLSVVCLSICLSVYLSFFSQYISQSVR